GPPAHPCILRWAGPSDRQPFVAVASAARAGAVGDRPPAVVAVRGRRRRTRLPGRRARPVPSCGSAPVSRRGVLDAVVVGAGVVGTAAALGLALQGRQVALVEGREPAGWRGDEPDLRVFALAPDNVGLLERLGAW